MISNYSKRNIIRLRCLLLSCAHAHSWTEVCACTVVRRSHNAAVRAAAGYDGVVTAAAGLRAGFSQPPSCT